VIKVMDIPPVLEERTDFNGSSAPYRIYNIGNNEPVDLGHFIEVLENLLGKKAVKNMLPMQAGDVPATYADIDSLIKDTGFKPETSIEEGLGHFVNWYRGRFT